MLPWLTPAFCCRPNHRRCSSAEGEPAGCCGESCYRLAAKQGFLAPASDALALSAQSTVPAADMDKVGEQRQQQQRQQQQQQQCKLEGEQDADIRKMSAASSASGQALLHRTSPAPDVAKSRKAALIAPDAANASSLPRATPAASGAAPMGPRVVQLRHQAGKNSPNSGSAASSSHRGSPTGPSSPGTVWHSLQACIATFQEHLTGSRKRTHSQAFQDQLPLTADTAAHLGFAPQASQSTAASQRAHTAKSALQGAAAMPTSSGRLHPPAPTRKTPLASPASTGTVDLTLTSSDSEGHHAAAKPNSSPQVQPQLGPAAQASPKSTTRGRSRRESGAGNDPIVIDFSTSGDTGGVVRPAAASPHETKTADSRHDQGQQR